MSTKCSVYKVQRKSTWRIKHENDADAPGMSCDPERVLLTFSPLEEKLMREEKAVVFFVKQKWQQAKITVEN